MQKDCACDSSVPADLFVPCNDCLDAMEQKTSLEALADWDGEREHPSRTSSRSSIRSDVDPPSSVPSTSFLAERLKQAEDYLQASQRSLASEVNQHRSDLRGIQADCQNLWIELNNTKKAVEHMAKLYDQMLKDLMWINAEQKRKFERIDFCTAICNKIVKKQAIEPEKHKLPTGKPVTRNPGCDGPISEWV